MNRTESIEKILIGVLIGIGLSICAIMLFLTMGVYEQNQDERDLPPPAEPAIKNAEFDFWIQYTAHGETMEIKDTLVCEYRGYSYSTSRSKNTRNWTKSFKSDDTAGHLVLYEWIETYGIETYAVVVELYPASYFMSDPDYTQDHEAGECPFAIKVYDVLKGYYVSDAERTEKLLDLCGFEITDWTCDLPVENTFS